MKNLTISLYGLDDGLFNILREIWSELEVPINQVATLQQLMKMPGENHLIIFHQNQLNIDVFEKFITSSKAPYKVCIGDQHQHDQLNSTPLPLVIDALTDKVNSILGSSDEERENELKEYAPIKISFIGHLMTAPCDIYIRLGKKEEDFRYVRRIHHEHQFEDDEVGTYVEKGITHLYVKQEDRPTFFQSLVSNISLEAIHEEQDIKGFLDLQADIHDIVTEVMELTSINNEIVDLADKGIKSMAATIQSSKSLLKLLKALLTNKSGFVFKHSYLITLFCFQIMKRSDYGKSARMKNRHEMMCFVAFFHDILLQDDRLAAIRNKKEFFRAKLNSKEKKLVDSHAHATAEMLGEIKGTPAEAAQILRQHHGTTNGMGFPAAYTASLTPLAIMFIVVEYFVLQLLDPSDNNADLPTIFKNCEKEFELPSYRKIVVMIREVFNLT